MNAEEEATQHEEVAALVQQQDAGEDVSSTQRHDHAADERQRVQRAIRTSQEVTEKSKTIREEAETAMKRAEEAQQSRQR